MSFVVATFNLHAGVDGWGVAFDVVGACAALGADVLVLQEAFTAEDGCSLAEAVATKLGYRALTVPLAPARRFPVPLRRPGMDRARWGPGRGTRTRSLAVDPAPDRPHPPRRKGPRGSRRPGADRGTWELAVLYRHRAAATKVLPLPHLSRDVAARQLALVELETDDGPFTVAGTHLAHLSHGSPVQMRALGRLLSAVDGPAALLGDMNSFGPPLVAMLPGWRRAVRGASWPSWQPVVQPDHILVNRRVTSSSGEILRVGDSDHFPARARLRW